MIDKKVAHLIGASEIDRFINTPTSLKLDKANPVEFSTYHTRLGLELEERITPVIIKKFGCKFEKQKQFIKEPFRATLDFYNKEKSLNVELKSMVSYRFKKSYEPYILEKFVSQISQQALLSGCKNNYLLVLNSESFEFYFKKIDVSKWFSLAYLMELYAVYEIIDIKDIYTSDPYWGELADQYGDLKAEEKDLKIKISDMRDKILINSKGKPRKGSGKSYSLSYSVGKGRFSMTNYPPIAKIMGEITREQKEEYISDGIERISYRKLKKKD